MKTRNLGCKCSQKQITHAKVSSKIKIYQVFQDNGKHRLSSVCKEVTTTEPCRDFHQVEMTGYGTNINVY